MAVAFSCLLDGGSKFAMQGWNLLSSLKSVGAFPDPEMSLFIHHTTAAEASILSMFKDSGATLVPVEPFGTHNARYCNKLRQLESEELTDFDYVILSDLDMLFTASPLRLSQGNAVRACPVHHPVPPELIWRSLFSSCGFTDDVPTTTPCFDHVSKTPYTNCNGGLYVLPQDAFSLLRSQWPRWARYCLSREDILGRFTQNADQLSFAIAMLHACLPFEPLAVDENFPTHLPPQAYQHQSTIDVKAFHYHDRMDPHGLMVPVGVPALDRQIMAMNARLLDGRRTHFSNQVFWNYRYSAHPALGSGLGSRGDIVHYKRDLLAPYFAQFKDHGVLDYGCGDLETTRYAPVTSYTGVDVTPSALAIARSKRPDWSFIEGNHDVIRPSSCALTLCLDVLIHQPSAEAYHAVLSTVVASATDAAIISGYDQSPRQAGIVFFHGSLGEHLKRIPGVVEVTQIGSYADLVVYLAVKSGGGRRSPHDAPLTTTAWGMHNTDHPALLRELITIGRSRLGFFPHTISRTIEYPWFAHKLGRAAGARVLDVGAGLNPLPFYLSDRGLHVTTLDSHRQDRTNTPHSTWNEWGYLDYSLVDPRIDSVRADMATYRSDQPYDALFSVSVIEHMPAQIRRAALRNFANLLRNGGALLLSVDLIPNSDKLWNLSEGKPVEDISVHGDFRDLCSELENAGFDIDEIAFRRKMPGSRTDTAFILARGVVR